MKQFRMLALLSLALLIAAFGCNKDNDNHDAVTNNSTAEVILTIQPGAGAANVPRQSAVVVTFSQSMMMDSTEHMFMLHIGQGVSGERLSGAFDWNDDRTAMTFRPSPLLAETTTYTVHFNGMMMGMDSMMMHPMVDTTACMSGMHGMHGGDMMRGMNEHEIVSVFSTGL